MLPKIHITALYCLSAVICIPAAYPQAENRSPSQERQSFHAELANIRALPFGYSAVCETGDLKIRSDVSATFVVRRSLLCELAQSSTDAAQRDGFALCSNNPAYRKDQQPLVVPQCHEFRIERTEI